jgi:hypothetical protein
VRHREGLRLSDPMHPDWEGLDITNDDNYDFGDLCLGSALGSLH